MKVRRERVPLFPVEAFKAELDKGAAAKVLGVRKEIAGVEVKANDDGTLDFTLSTASVDRARDVISQDGWRLDNYRKNPVVLWAHDYRIAPVATAKQVAIEDGKLKARSVQFADPDLIHTPDGTAGFGHSIGEMYRRGFLNAVSVGFLPAKWNWNEDRKGGIDFLEQELLEWSAVPVPANPEALVGAKAAGVPLEPLVEWAEKILDARDAAGAEPPDPAVREYVERLYAAAKPYRLISAPPRAASVRVDDVRYSDPAEPEEREERAEEPAAGEAEGACEACLAACSACQTVCAACVAACQRGGDAECAAACEQCALECDACADACDDHGEACAPCASACRACAAACRACAAACKAVTEPKPNNGAAAQPLTGTEIARLIAEETATQLSAQLGR